MAHQIKNLMAEKEGVQLIGEVICDETYTGMLSKNMHSDSLVDAATNKTGVIEFIDKKGKIVTKILGVETDSMQSFAPIVIDNVDLNAVRIKYAYPTYKNLDKVFAKYIRIDHIENEYVKGDFTTNNVEKYWSTLKRMIKGTQNHVSRIHLLKYVAENTFRYLNRSEPKICFTRYFKC